MGYGAGFPAPYHETVRKVFPHTVFRSSTLSVHGHSLLHIHIMRLCIHRHKKDDPAIGSSFSLNFNNELSFPTYYSIDSYESLTQLF